MTTPQVLGRHCRALVTAFAHSEHPDEPTEDPVVSALLNEVAEFPHPSEAILYLASMNVVAFRRVNRYARARNTRGLSVVELREEMWVERERGRLVLLKAFELIEGLASEPVDRDANEDSLRILTEAWGVVAVVVLAEIHLRIALHASEVDSALTLEILLAEWALSDERALLEESPPTEEDGGD